MGEIKNKSLQEGVRHCKEMRPSLRVDLDPVMRREAPKIGVNSYFAPGFPPILDLSWLCWDDWIISLTGFPNREFRMNFF